MIFNATGTEGTELEMWQFYLEAAVGFKRLSAQAASTTAPQRQGCFILAAQLQQEENAE